MDLPIYPQAAFTGEFTAYEFEKLTIPTDAVRTPTAAKLSAAGKHNADRAWITVETGNIRWTIHGGDPTATDGHLGYADGNVEVLGKTNVAALRMIAETVEATVQITYSRYEE